jgi:very-short-patch-repair endonuclease
MNRPLQNDSVFDLTVKAERNWDNRAELELILSELRHRSTQAAEILRGRVEMWIKDCAPFAYIRANQAGRTEHSPKPVATLPRHPQTREWTYDAVAKLRAKLIDLSRRSPLIAFKHSSRSVSQLRFVDERPDLLFERLNKGSMGFEPLPGEEQTPSDERTPQFGIAYEHARLTDSEFLAATEKLGEGEGDARAWQNAERSLRGRVRAQLGLPKLDYGKSLDVLALARAHGFDPSYDLKPSDDGSIAAHHEDDNIRVLLTLKELDRRLKSIDDRATSHLRETGHHTLHLAFGFIQWFEDDASDIALHAPLLLLPVKIVKDDGRTKKTFRLNIWEGGLEVNVALIEKAREHWGLQIPKLRADETPESYFVRVKAVIEQGRRLTLRTFVTLSVLPPMILWRDLDPAKWPDGAFSEHRLLPGLVGAAEISGVDGDDTLIDIDDPANETRVPSLITDADASQHHAIMDMAAGRDMAIEGPPGTGKSQTITNMIATALFQGKRVLFVAEKQAALRVVSNRLRASGFGPLLLELHGDKASRSDVYAGVRERFEAQSRLDAHALNNKRVELRRHRDLLRRYLTLVRAPLGKFGKNAHTLAWREIRLRKLFNYQQIKAMEVSWTPKDLAELNFQSMNENRDLRAQFGKAFVAIDQSERGDRTRWTLAEGLNPFDQSAALDAAAAAGKAANAVAEVAQRFAQIGGALPKPGDDKISDASKQLSAIIPLTCSEEAIVRAALHHRSMCLALLAAQSEWRRQREGLADEVAHPETVSLSAVEAMREALRIDRCPETLAEVLKGQSVSERLATSLGAAVRDIERAVARLADGTGTTVSKAQKVALSFAEIGRTSPVIDALLSSKLLDAASEGVIASSTAEAKALLTERDEIAVLTQGEALSVEPAELDDIAETIDSTGKIARIFSGRYKTAWRRAARLCTDTSDRVQTASNLRKVARYLRSRRSFNDECKARTLFPAMLWDGMASDFVSLRAARSLVSEVASHLATLDEAGVLQWWLASNTSERQTFAAACERLVALLAEFNEAGFASVVIADLQSVCSQRIDDLKRIADACKAVGIRKDALFQRTTGGTIVDTLADFQKAHKEFTRLCQQPIFCWVGDITASLEPLQQSLAEIANLTTLSGPIELNSLLNDADAPAALVSTITEIATALLRAAEEWEKTTDQLWNTAELNTVSLCISLDWQQASEGLLKLSNDREGASAVADLLKYKSIVTKRNLTVFADAVNSNLVSAASIDDMYELLAVSKILRSYLGGDGEELGRLGSLSLDAARQSFKKVDKELHKLEAAAIVASRLTDTVPVGVGYGRKADFTDLRLLENEVELTRPRTSLRDVTARAGEALQALKPVWMMSPTSIAQFIRPGSLKFDLLIVDEASQMRPEFSLSCILRADQFVVVGDANQLPPSDHFQIAGANEGDDDDDGVGIDDSTESILDLANQRFRTKRRLKWHYRSQHESLIQFSNRNFYERDLVVFPSPTANDDDFLGVKCFYVPSFYPDTAYGASINQREAEMVIEQAFALMQTHPERSIGIVAMNAKQTELIQNEFERLKVEDDRVQKYIEAFAGTIDEFFIKNLENVQGDERDVIIISTVYGPDKNGAVRQNFGLMNREVGWRRLNVLVTRAKMSCRLITSLRPDDVKVIEGKSSKGLIAFKSYLTYAHGGAHYDDAAGAETDSDFEIFVADALRAGGYEVVYQVGVENFRIDLGVRHKDCPVGFIAGIECDGATYHTGLTVRDRDHIRQTILENLGWNIYRVWSTDWFADAARETAKLLSWLDRVREHAVRELGEQPPSVEVKPKQKVVPTSADAIKTDFNQLIVIEPKVEQFNRLASVAAKREPRGRELRSLGDFQTYEAVRGRLYEVWRDQEFLGEVEVVRRSTAAPKLYGDRAVTAQSEYEGRIELSGDSFRSFDLYAAMREVASRAFACASA